MISDEDRFQFDLAGFIVLRGVLTGTECDEILSVLNDLETRDYEDVWLKETGARRPTKETHRDHQIRLNGLPRLHSAFDRLIDHDTLVPYLFEFVGDPQLINTWSISKAKGSAFSGWHRGIPTTDYTYRNGDIPELFADVEDLLIEMPAGIWRETPQLGEHTELWLVEELGYTWDDIGDLQAKGIIP
mgnify:CR=1 FL=1